MKQTNRKPHYRTGADTICALHKGASWMQWVHSAEVADSLHVSRTTLSGYSRAVVPSTWPETAVPIYAVLCMCALLCLPHLANRAPAVRTPIAVIWFQGVREISSAA